MARALNAVGNGSRLDAELTPGDFLNASVVYDHPKFRSRG